MTVIFRQPGQVTWASPDGSQERRAVVYAGMQLPNVEIYKDHPEQPDSAVLIINAEGWTLLMPPQYISIIRDRPLDL